MMVIMIIMYDDDDNVWWWKWYNIYEIVMSDDIDDYSISNDDDNENDFGDNDNDNYYDNYNVQTEIVFNCKNIITSIIPMYIYVASIENNLFHDILWKIYLKNSFQSKDDDDDDNNDGIKHISLLHIKYKK